MRTLIAAIGMSLISCPLFASVPSNDHVRRATRIDVLPFVNAIDTRDATTAPSDPDCVGRGPTVWYSFVAEEDAELAISTFGSSYDTTLSAYIQDAAGILAIACNDDTGDTLQSELRLSVVAGVTYLFMVGSFASGPGGDLVFTAATARELPQLLVEPVASLRQPGLLTLRGSITCSQPSVVFIGGEVAQTVRKGPRDRRAPTWATFPFRDINCYGRTRWTTRPVPRFELFERGPATVLATVFVCGDVSCESYPLAASVSVVRARRAER